jgi:colicin import membrane protein
MAQPAPKMPADWEMVPSSPDADPFRYGWRPRYVRLPSGEVHEERIPLTAEDLLDPQLGDIVVQGGEHYWLVHQLAGMLKRHFKPRKDVYVAADMKILWGIPGLEDPAPDIAIIPGVRRKLDPQPDSWDVGKEGTRPCFILEVVSSKDSKTRHNDYEEKVRIYRRAGIKEYFILDPPIQVTRKRFLLTGYRLEEDGRYRKIQPDDRGYLFSETTNLLFSISKDGSKAHVIDNSTGDRLLTEEEARLAAEERAAREAKARRAAEKRAVLAEARAANEAEARKALEAELEKLRAELERRQ